MKKFILINRNYTLFLIFSIFIVNSLYAQDKFSTDFYAGNVVPVGKFAENNTNNLILGVKESYGISKTIDVVVELSWINFPRISKQTQEHNPINQIIQITSGIRPKLDLNKNFIIYTELQLGMYFTDESVFLSRDETETKTNFGSNVGIGSSYQIRNGVNLFLESKFHNIFAKENLSYFALQGGARINF